MGLSVCFVVGALGPSGGVRAVTEHARALTREHEMDVALAVWSGRDVPSRSDLPVLTIAEARERRFDVAVATWWRTAFALFGIPARRYAYFVQQLEERVYRPGEVERLGAAVTHDIPVAFLTEAAWIAALLRELRPDAPVFHVPNGIDKRLFTAAAPARTREPLRVLVEGSPHLWFKGIPDATAVLGRARAPLATTLVTPEVPDDKTRTAFDRVIGPVEHDAMPGVYAGADVLLKLSRVEGVFTPPLEAFHVGTPCVVWPVTGHDEYVEHGRNGVVCDFDDIAGTANWLNLLARNPALLARLRRGALETAAAWPSWSEATTEFALALEQIAAADAPAPRGAAQLLADVDAAMTEQRMAQRRLMRDAEGLERRLTSLESTLAVRARERTRRLLASIRR
jgi:glycosyltransferase involved in cell wall biosynthesis